MATNAAVFKFLNLLHNMATIAAFLNLLLNMALGLNFACLRLYYCLFVRKKVVAERQDTGLKIERF